MCGVLWLKSAFVAAISHALELDTYLPETDLQGHWLTFTMNIYAILSQIRRSVML